MVATSADLQVEGSTSTLAVVRPLCVRSDRKGLMRLAGHATIVTASTLLLASALGTPWQVPLTVVHGALLGTLFAVVHEGVHYTAFRSRWLNEWAAWIAGLIIGLNSSFYRQFHYEHHRCTQIPGRDPELGALSPTSFKSYAIRLSGFGYWRNRLVHLVDISFGRFDSHPYVPRSKQCEVQASMRWSGGIYLLVLGYSLLAGDATAFWLWLLPLVCGQPVIRFWLLSEHTGCSNDGNPFTNTRTTRVSGLTRYVIWNMSFHAEHHLHPAIPFHALPAAHQAIGERFHHVANGYIETHRDIIARLLERAGGQRA